MESGTIKSVITCDLEGRIETFNDGAAELFGYSAEEVIGKKRVSLFSPGLVVLGHVGQWLAEASEKGEFTTQTVFVKRDGTPFTADIKLTPTKRDGEQIGFCGVTVPRPDVDPGQAMPPISLLTRIFAWLVVTRAPFLTATIIPVLVGAAWVGYRSASAFPWGLFGLVMAGATLLHVAANTFNDYFDWTSGTDEANASYFLPFSGGSRSIELGLVTEKKLLRVATGALLGSAAIGACLAWIHGPQLLLFGVVGAFSAYFYTAPPLRLCARKGLGELFVGLNFGPLMTAGTAFALTGFLSVWDFVIGLPVGLLTTAILWVNQFPDAPSDEATGKKNLVVVLGTARARWGYLTLMVAAFGSMVAAVAANILPPGTLVALAALPLAAYATVIVFRHYANRTLIRASAATIQLHLLAGILMTAGLVGTILLRAPAG